MKRDKTPNDVRGVQISCTNYIKCPFCYGCRNYCSYDPQCQICKSTNEKYNLCNTEKHQSEVISKMIIKDKIIINKKGENN